MKKSTIINIGIVFVIVVLLAIEVVVIISIIKTRCAKQQTAIEDIITITKSKTDSIHTLIHTKDSIVFVINEKIIELEKQSDNEELKIQTPDYSIDSVRAYIRTRIQEYRHNNLLQQ